MLPTRSHRPIFYNRGMIAETGTIPDGLQLIRDTHSFKVMDVKKVVMESVVNGKKTSEPIMKVTGLFQEGDLLNANGRVYPRPILAEAVRIIQEDVSNRAVLAEFDHPPDAKIHLDRLSHLVTKLWMEGTKVYGEAEILDNQPLGRSLRGLFERKVRVGISSRGIGDMEMREDQTQSGKQYYEVLPGYQLVTFDAVAEPSVHGANLKLMENLNQKTAPLHEAREKSSAGRSGRASFLGDKDYQDLLLEAINNHYGISDFGPRRKYGDR